MYLGCFNHLPTRSMLDAAEKELDGPGQSKRACRYPSHHSGSIISPKQPFSFSRVSVIYLSPLE